MSSYSEYLVSWVGVGGASGHSRRLHAGAAMRIPYAERRRRAALAPHVCPDVGSYARRGAWPTSRTLSRDADVRIPGLFPLVALAPATADGTVLSDGGDAPDATDEPRRARPVRDPHPRTRDATTATTVTTVTTATT